MLLKLYVRIFVTVLRMLNLYMNGKEEYKELELNFAFSIR